MIIVYQEQVNTSPKNIVISDVTKDLFNTEEEYLEHIQIIARNDIWKYLERDTRVVTYKNNIANLRLPTILNIF